VCSRWHRLLQKAHEHWRELDARLQCDGRIAAQQKDDEQVQRAAELKGVGQISNPVSDGIYP